jgi:hypothetical protein
MASRQRQGSFSRRFPPASVTKCVYFPLHATPPQAGIDHPALNDLADDCRAIALPMLAYMGILALLVIGAMVLWDGLELEVPTAATAGWSQTGRAAPASPQKLELRGSL